MSPLYTYPGVYIEEVTGPGVIAGIGTGTAAFIGPAGAGPLLQPMRITSLDAYMSIFGSEHKGRLWPYLYAGSTPYYLGFAVEGFFRNGGTQAFVVRVGTGARSRLVFQNRANENAFVVRAVAEGIAGAAVSAALELSAGLTVATGSQPITEIADRTVQVHSAAPFRVGDEVTTDGANRARIEQIQGSTLTLHAALPNTVKPGDNLRVGDLLQNNLAEFRLDSTWSLAKGAIVQMKVGNANPTRETVGAVNVQTGFIGLESGPSKKYLTSGAAPTVTAIRLLVIAATGISSGAVVANPQGNLVTRLSVDHPELFVPGDTVTADANVNAAVIDRIVGADLWLTTQFGGVVGNQVRLANVKAGTTTFRLDRTDGLAPGGALEIKSAAGTSTVSIASVTPSGLVRLTSDSTISVTHPLSGGAGTEPVVTPQEMRLVITPPASSAAEVTRFDGLSLNSQHPRYVLNRGVVTSELVTIESPDSPPTTAALPGALAKAMLKAALSGGRDDQPQALAAADYQDALDVLRDIDDVNLVVVPDAARHADRRMIQQAVIDHCLALEDRFAILDAAPGSPPFGAGSAEEQRGEVTADRGFAAFYYPWILANDPTAPGATPRTMTLPPSGHLAGVYARTDTERGVHKAPANTDVRGALGVETPLSDRMQGPLNLKGVNVLRVFPGNGQVIVWGARTTVQPDVTDWLYVNVRRLLLFIEESIQEGIRWAIFEGNDLALWKKLTRTIRAFLTQVWRDGGLFGATPDEAFQIRIDEALNPPSEQSLGRLHIEIQVAPVRPAEFIAVRIGLWVGGGDITES
jgi:phage tail sheath protein FI